MNATFKLKHWKSKGMQEKEFNMRVQCVEKIPSFRITVCDKQGLGTHTHFVNFVMSRLNYKWDLCRKIWSYGSWDIIQNIRTRAGKVSKMSLVRHHQMRQMLWWIWLLTLAKFKICPRPAAWGTCYYERTSGFFEPWKHTEMNIHVLSKNNAMHMMYIMQAIHSMSIMLVKRYNVQKHTRLQNLQQQISQKTIHMYM